MKGNGGMETKNKMRETKYEKIEMKRAVYIIIGIGAAMFGLAPKALAQA